MPGLLYRGGQRPYPPTACACWNLITSYWHPFSSDRGPCCAHWNSIEISPHEGRRPAGGDAGQQRRAIGRSGRPVYRNLCRIEQRHPRGHHDPKSQSQFRRDLRAGIKPHGDRRADGVDRHQGAGAQHLDLEGRRYRAAGLPLPAGRAALTQDQHAVRLGSQAHPRQGQGRDQGAGSGARHVRQPALPSRHQPRPQGGETDPGLCRGGKRQDQAIPHRTDRQRKAGNALGRARHHQAGKTQSRQ